MGGVVYAAPFQVVGVVAHGGEAAGGEDDADSVVTFLQQVGHVVGVEVDAARIVAQGRLHQLVGGHLLTVEKCLILAKAADVEARVIDVLSQIELLAQIACRHFGVALDLVVIVVASNPVGVPVAAVEEADFEVLHRAFELFTLTIAVCHSSVDPPPAAFAAF